MTFTFLVFSLIFYFKVQCYFLFIGFMFLQNKIVMNFEIWSSTFVYGYVFVLANLNSVIKRHEGKKKRKQLKVQ
jgi:hypothetical protein